MNNLFFRWSLNRRPWLVVALSAVAFELGALYFQYGKHLEPCVMCVYERTAMIGILISALVGAAVPSWLITRWIGILGFIASSSWGLALAWTHTQIQLHPSPFEVCSPYPHFPHWLPLNQWFPWMFQPHGDCSVIVWKMFGWSMPQWLILSFAIYLLLAVVIAWSQLRRR